MAQVYGEIDTLKRLLSNLRRSRIHTLVNVEDIEAFLSTYWDKIEEIREGVHRDIKCKIAVRNEEIIKQQEVYEQKVNDYGELLIREKKELPERITNISRLPSNFFSVLPRKIKLFFLNQRLKRITKHFDKEKIRPYRKIKKRIRRAVERLGKLQNLPEKRIDKIVLKRGGDIIQTKRVLDRNYSLVAGAIGEYKAVCELANLPHSYYVVNDFQQRFRKPIYNRRTGERIYSIQVDHVVVGPSGIFLIETKNWSQDTMDMGDLYSPAAQVKRAGFGLFCYLNTCINRGFLSLFRSSQKIQIRNIVLVVNGKPREQLEFVKVLNVYDVNQYILYFKPMYSQKEVEQIVSYLL